jgi:uncharacterized protein (TIGR00725 family)
LGGLQVFALVLCSESRALYREGRRFDPWRLSWEAGDFAPTKGCPIDPLAAVAWLFSEGGGRRVPVAVIGPKAAEPDQLRIAETLGARIGDLGLCLLTGGRGGVMEAASKGCAGAGGLTVGLLPDDDWRAANPHVALPLASGIGPARNALIARAALALVAVGGGYGTLSEIALGLHFDKPVFAIAGAPAVEGAIPCATIDEIVARLADAILGLDEPESGRG